MRLIDVDALPIAELQPNTAMSPAQTFAHNEVVRQVLSAPTVDAQPVTHGNWENDGFWFKCSCCGFRVPFIKENKYCPNCGAKMELKEEMEKQTMENNTENKNEISEEMNTAQKLFNGFMNSIFAMCNDCVKSDVCNLKGTKDMEPVCKHFQNAMNYKRYGNINDMFQPIFDWLKFHYPHGEVYFFVENNRAMMLQEHGPCAFSKEITQFTGPIIKPDETEKNDK